MRIVAILVITLAWLGAAPGCSKEAPTAPPPAAAGAVTPAAPAKMAEVWTCPMHPEVVSDKPATCPKCGMKLELKK